jgi:Bifunctional DNA primase/polymerase, N-terminal
VSSPKAAEQYAKVGISITPLEGKEPILNNWPNVEIPLEEIPRLFNRGKNIGAKLGKPSGGLVDVDQDRPEARAVGEHLLRRTKTSGREGKPHGHAWYWVTGRLPETRKFELPGKGPDRMVVELRSTNAQTLVPPSVYPDGDVCVWGGTSGTARIAGDELVRDVEDTAIAALLLINYPGVGARHEFCMCVAGYLLRRLSLERTKRIVNAAALAAGDPELRDRLRAVETTAEKIAAGERVKGGPQLEKLAPGITKVMRGWLGWGEGRDDGLPRVLITNRPLRHKSTDALNTLLEVNDPPQLFVRSGQLARIGKDEEDEPIVQEVGEARLRHHMSLAANFVRAGRDGEVVHVSPPEDVVKDVLARAVWPFPSLIGVSRVPFFRPDGTLVKQAGYDSVTRIFYAPAPGLAVEVPEQPTRGDVRRALELVEECIGDFPYADEASAANALAMLSTPILRTVIPGPVPLAAIDKPTPGTGGSLLADVAALVATGRPAGMASAPRDDEEVRKQITSALRAGSPVITIDNVSGDLSAPSLARALTAEIWEDRLLGRSEQVKLPQRATWLASGNNLKLGGDIPRRSYWIRLDAKTEKPWERRGFRHPNLKEWVCENRGALVSALLTLARAWFVEGRPEDEDAPKLGGFEGWVSTVGGVIANLEMRGFLGNLDELYERSGDDAGEWEHFLTTWRTEYQESPKKTAEIAADLYRDESKELRAALPEDLAALVEAKDPHLSRKLGKAFSAREDRRYGSDGVYLRRAGTEKRAVRWTVAVTSPEERSGVSLTSLVSSFHPNAGEKHTSNGLATNKDATGNRGETHTNNSPNSPDQGDADYERLWQERSQALREKL